MPEIERCSSISDTIINPLSHTTRAKMKNNKVSQIKHFRYNISFIYSKLCLNLQNYIIIIHATEEIEKEREKIRGGRKRNLRVNHSQYSESICLENEIYLL